MNFELSSGNVALGLAILGAFAQFIRLEVAATNQERRITSLETKQKSDIDQLHDSHNSRDRAIWEKIETIHSTLLTIVQALGRLEGKTNKDK